MSRLSKRFAAGAAAAFIAAVTVGGWLYPPLGLALPLLILVAAVMSFVRPRSFCRTVCPRRRLFPLFRGISRYAPLPKVLRGRTLRQTLCAFMMFCSAGQLLRLARGYATLATAGNFFWSMCVITLAAAFTMGVLFKPAAWCSVCPMGTMQETLASARKPVEKR